MVKSEKLEFGTAADQVYDFTPLAANLAFRATSSYEEMKTASIDPTIAKWTARLVSTKDNKWSD